jgi:hypothetical protein
MKSINARERAGSDTLLEGIATMAGVHAAL